MQQFELRLANQQQQTSTAKAAYENARDRAQQLYDQNELYYQQNQSLGKRVVIETERANRSDSLLAPYQKRLCKYEGCTWAGKQLRKVDKGAKVTGYIAALALLLKFVL